jgi:hypothetical protein
MSKDYQRAIHTLARVMYHFYCQEKKFTPYAQPWVPRWAIDYAELAVKHYGYTDEAVDELTEDLDKLETPAEVA